MLFHHAVCLCGYLTRWCAQIISIRKRYIPLYKQCVAAGQLGGNEAVWDLDKQLPEKTIVLFRTIALAVRRRLYV